MDLPVDAEGWIELCVRCWDNSLNTQPTFVRSAWNWDLHVSFSVSVLAELSSDMEQVTSSCHRIKVYSVNTTRQATQKRLTALKKAGLGLEPLTRPLEIEQEEDDEYVANMKRFHGRDPVE